MNNPTRNNKPYTTKENKLIWSAYHNGEHPAVIALRMSRTEKGIYNQITTLKKTLKPRPRLPPKAKATSDWETIVRIIEDEKKLEKKTKRKLIERKPREPKKDNISIGLTYVCAVAVGVLAGLLIATYL